MVPDETSKREKETVRNSLRNTALEAISSFVQAKVTFRGIAVLMQREERKENELFGRE